MSRSKRKTPFFGFTTATSEKLMKRKWNKRFRRVAKALMLVDKEIPVKKQAVSDIWEGGKDGKFYWKAHTKKDMRK
ncbi:hypothetical protein EZ428_15790 [Pedobacter frigiditerrae]|uniref:Uncharacterized protein n=1 Tax=Pedobacter frigiditerrae TaxID=2530452 RepID=A0A4R0MSH4_9SPHI|nr:hypothetical protein [Pedobacter frigiditerrae]TCC89162.1 hypothetical protein EZ428_15790 [Pedobacter frigiditerrae]